MYNGSRDMAATKRLDYALFQSFTIAIDPTIQDSDKDYLLFDIPKPIAVNQHTDGIVYAGKADDSVAFTKLRNRSDVANMKKRGFLRDGKDIAVIYEIPYLLVFGNKMLKEIYFQGVLANPLNKPNFNPETDEYPVSDAILDLMTDLFKKEQSISINKVADPIADNRETMAAGIISQNTKA